MSFAGASLKERQDWAQPALVLISAAVAYLLPFEGVLLSYAILGPAHYLTQLNWLHDRNYFVADPAARWLFVGIGVAGLAFIMIVTRTNESAAVYFVVTLGLALLLLLPGLAMPVLSALAVALAIVGWLLAQLPLVILIAAVLLSTIIHVGLFTLMFLLQGARKRGDLAGKITAAAWLVCAALLLLLPPELRLLWPDWFAGQRQFFDAVAAAMGAGPDGRLDARWAAAYGVLTFAYTYHYLNWFTKTELLQWHRISRARLVPIVAIYLASVGVYFYDYALGYQILITLSVLHVVAEFPLDAQVARSLLRPMPRTQAG
jgi:hypothetical protein